MKTGEDVFVGLVTYASLTVEEQRSRSVSPLNPYQMVNFTIEEDFTGIGKTKLTLRTQTVACGYSFESGQRYLVFATRTGQPGLWTTSICSRTTRLGSKRADRDLAYLRSLRKPGEHAVVWGFVYYGSPGLYDGPVDRIRVRLFAQGQVREDVTDDNGVFEFTDLAKGHYRLELPTRPENTRDVEVKVALDQKRGQAPIPGLVKQSWEITF